MNKEDIFIGLEKILREQNRSEEDIKDIYKAFKFAEKLHEGQYRVSEEPYIIHPVEVTKILATLKVDKNTLMASILHDTIEDTGITEGTLEISATVKGSNIQYPSTGERQYSKK